MSRKKIIRRILVAIGMLFLLGLLILMGLLFEMATGQRVLPYDPYSNCGTSIVEDLPDTIRTGLYEEFPVAWRLDKLALVDFPVSLAIAAPTRSEFLELQSSITQRYPQVETVYFWPTIAPEEGYYLGAWSDAVAIQRAANEAESLPVLWDLEMPGGMQGLSIGSVQANIKFLDEWFSQREEPVHIWRSHTSMGLNPPFLRMMGIHFDPNDYPQIYLHLNLYMTGDGLNDDELSRILRCGVEQYGERFIPSLGVLNDGEGAEDIFVPVETLRRNLQLAREAGVSEIWLFGVNGLNEDYLQAIHETIPLTE